MLNDARIFATLHVREKEFQIYSPRYQINNEYAIFNGLNSAQMCIA